jgi:PAS domain-containing protein
MEGKRQKHLTLILAREFAAQLSMPVFITDDQGKLVFYNEPAEDVLGRTFAEAGEMVATEWQSTFSLETLDGRPMQLEEMPGGIALLERRPAHDALRMTGLDGKRREVAVSAFPLLGHDQDLFGVTIMFWEQSAD